MKYFADYSNKYLPCLKASYAHYQDAFHCSVGEHFKLFFFYMPAWHISILAASSWLQSMIAKQFAAIAAGKRRMEETAPDDEVTWSHRPK